MAQAHVEVETATYCETVGCGQRIESKGEKICLDCRFGNSPSGDNFPAVLINENGEGI